MKKAKKASVAVPPQSGIQRLDLTTKNGNTIQVFYNPDNNLLVVDLLAANDMGGNELLRKTLNEKEMLAHLKPGLTTIGKKV